jgi:hypothetical protein
MSNVLSELKDKMAVAKGDAKKTKEKRTPQATRTKKSVDQPMASTDTPDDDAAQDDPVIHKLEAKVARLTLQGMRELQARTERTYALGEGFEDYNADLQAVMKAWRDGLVPGKPHPLGKVHLLLGRILLEHFLVRFDAIAPDLMAVYPEHRAVLTKQMATTLVQNAKDQPEIINCFLVQIVYFTTKKGLGILKVAPGIRRLAPPSFPVPMEALHLMEWVCFPLRAAEEMGPGPKSRFEKALVKKLRKP